MKVDLYDKVKMLNFAKLYNQTINHLILFSMKNKYFAGVIGILMCAAMCVFSSCADTKLKNSVEKANKDCPVSLGIVGELTSIEYKGDAVEFLFNLDEEFIKIDAITDNLEDTKASAITNMAGNENVNKMFDMLIETGTNLRFVWKGKDSGEEATIEFTPAEIKEIRETPAATDEEKLASAIAATNRQLPLDTGTGVVVTEMIDKGNVVAYMNQVPDEEFLMQVAKNTDAVKNSQKTYFKMMSSTEKNLFRLIAELGKKLSYTYYTDGSDETVEVVYTSEELKKIFDE